MLLAYDFVNLIKLILNRFWANMQQNRNISEDLNKILTIVINNILKLFAINKLNKKLFS